MYRKNCGPLLGYAKEELAQNPDSVWYIFAMASKVLTALAMLLAIAQVQEVEKLVRETLIDRFVDKLSQAGSL